jgi:hypothetical protein
MQPSILQNKISDILNDASNLLSRATISWGLFSEDETVLASGYILAGSSLDKFYQQIEEFGQSVDVIYLSIEPFLGGFDSHILVEMIKAFNISLIYIGSKAPVSLQCSQWQNWKGLNQQKIIECEYSNFLTRMSRAFTRIETVQRPWVTAITAADIGGRACNLASLTEEFGFIRSIKHVLCGTNRIICLADESIFLNRMSDRYNSEDLPPVVIIQNHEDINHYLTQCIDEGVFSVCLLAGSRSIGPMIENNLIDELIHHWVVTLNIDHNPVNSVQFAMPFDQWKMVSSTPFTSFNQFVIQNTASI